MNLDCEPFQKRYIDIFMLIFYLIGINLVDLTHLKKIDNGYIEYTRSKTNRPYLIKVEPEAFEIINRYKGTNYLINILDNYTNYTSFTSKINAQLKRIGLVYTDSKGNKITKPLFPYLTTYYARHTWATIAASLDIPKETIAAALGHGGNTVTDIYINFDQKKIDQANRKVIDYLLEI